MVSCQWGGWNEKYLLSLWKENIFLWIFFYYCLDCFSNDCFSIFLMKDDSEPPLSQANWRMHSSFLFFFPLTNAPRRSLSGPRDSSGWSITARTSASQRIISWMGGSGEGERGARLVSSVKGSDGLLSLEVLWDSPKDIHSSPRGWPSPLIFYSK